MADKSVPMRWKLYALINGFWISGLEVFASNKFFAEKLQCTERHIQGCLEDLEGLKVIRREVHGMDRKIYPATNPAFVPARTGSSQSHEPSVRHNSVSNSDSLIIETEEKPRRATYAESVGYASNRVKPIRLKGEEVSGRKFVNALAQEKHIASCLRAGYSEEEILTCFVSLRADEFWGPRGVDFGTVASQIGKAKKADEPIMSFGKPKN